MKRTAFLLFAVLVLASARRAAAEEERPVRMFDVAAILDERTDPPIERIGLGEPTWLDAMEEEEPAPTGLLTRDELEILVTTFVAPEAFDSGEASIDWTGDDRLEVAAPRPILDAVAVFLDDLFLVATRRVVVRADLLAFDGAGAKRLAESGLLGSLLGGRIGAADREALISHAGRPGARRVTGATAVRSGRLARFGRTSAFSYVADFDVEIAQGSIVGDPVVAFASEGFLLHVRPFLLADGAFFLEAVSQAAELAEPVRELNPEAEPLGTIALPAMRLERFLAAGRVAPGETLAVVRRSGAGPDAMTVLLLTPEVAGTPPRNPVAHHLSAALLAARGIVARAGWPGDDSGDAGDLPAPVRRTLLGAPIAVFERTEPVLHYDRLVGLADAADGVSLATEEGLWVGAADAAGPIRDRIAALEKPVARSYRVKLAVAVAGEGGPRRLHEIDLDVPAGRDAFYEVGTSRAFLADWDVEVAQEARVGDPIIGRAFGGLLVNLRLDPSPGGEAISGRVSLALVDLDPAFRTVRPGSDRTGVIEVPRSRQALVFEEVVLAPGRPIELHGGEAEGFGRLAVTLEATPR